MNGCAPGLALIERLKATRKWDINTPVTIHAVWCDLFCRIPNHSSTILKCLLKLLVDVTDSSAHLTTEGLFAKILQ